jgi:hypothetical protein
MPIGLQLGQIGHVWKPSEGRVVARRTHDSHDHDSAQTKEKPNTVTALNSPPLTPGNLTNLTTAFGEEEASSIALPFRSTSTQWLGCPR